MPRNQSERVKPFGPFEPWPRGSNTAEAEVEHLVGHTLTKIEGAEAGDHEVIFHLKDATFKMYHEQDCCENVSLDDVIGDIKDLIGSPLTMAEVVCGDDEELHKPQREGSGDSHTWTFYKFATVKGYVTLRWYGESNGYYSEEVYFVRIK